MASYAFVIAATAGYEEPAQVFINSAKKHCPDIDIHLLTEKEVPQHKENQLLMNYIYRLKYAAELTEYDAVCIVDADMFLVCDVTNFFDIASYVGLMVGASDCTNIYYEEGYRKRYPDILAGNFYNTKTISSVPLFFNPLKHGHILKKAYRWGISTGITSDLTVLNMFICADKDIWKKLIVLPACSWTGIHHSQLKPETRIRKILGQYVSEAGGEVYMIHGRWFDPSWVAGLRTTMEGYFRNHFNMTDAQLPKFMTWVDDSINICLSAYRELL